MSVGTDVAATARALHARLAPRLDEMLADLAALVALDSPSHDVAALGRTAEWLERWLAPVGRVRAIEAHDGRRHLLLETPDARDGGALVLCHYDTVWPVGTSDAWGFELAGAFATGPGVLDMKASIVCARNALLALQELGAPRAARLLISADEEIGNPTSRTLIHDLASNAGAALVLEPPLDDGRLKTARKGHATATIEVTGQAAHAGLAPQQGVNAIEQLAGIVQKLSAIAALIPGCSASTGRIEGGGAVNVVPERATAAVDLRAWSSADMAALVERVEALRPEHPGAHLAVAAHVDRPPLERLPSTAVLLERCVEASRAVGLEVREGSTGGCSEGNLAQAAGAPVLDGLGVRGSGPHTRDERIELAHVLPQAAVIGALVAELGAQSDA